MSSITKETIVSQLESTEEFPIALSDVWEWLGYARKDNALKGFLRLEMAESIDFIQFRQAAEDALKGSLEVKMTIDCFKLWAMSAQTAKGKEVRLYYIQVEKEWKAQKSAAPQVSLEQVEAFQFQRNVFDPWVVDHPIAANVFLEWQGLGSRPEVVTAPTLNPSLEAQAALNGAFLNLNRSGLMMNKLFKFLDRIPTMKALDEEFVNDLVKGLQASEAALEKTKAALAREKADNRSVRLENQSLIQELRESQIECRDLREAAANANGSKGSAIVLR